MSAISTICSIFKKHKSFLTSKELSNIIRERFKEVTIDSGMTNFPRVSTMQINGKLYYLRLYSLNNLLNASRYLWASYCLKKSKIMTPKIEQTCLTSIAEIKCYAVLENRLPGKEMASIKQNSIITGNFANDLRQWHNIPRVFYKNYKGIFAIHDKKHFGTRINRKALPNITLNEKQLELISQAKGLIHKPELYSHMSISHGDVNPHNLIIHKENTIAWVDMDMICLQPIWYDLAAAMCKIMIKNHPSDINVFEKAYFKNKPELYQEWKLLKNHWLFLYNVLEAVKWFATDRTKRLGSKQFSNNNPNLDSFKWGQKYFIQAEAILNLANQNLSSGEIISEMNYAVEDFKSLKRLPNNNEAYQERINA